MQMWWAHLILLLFAGIAFACIYFFHDKGQDPYALNWVSTWVVFGLTLLSLIGGFVTLRAKSANVIEQSYQPQPYQSRQPPPRRQRPSRLQRQGAVRSNIGDLETPIGTRSLRGAREELMPYTNSL